MDPAQPDRFYPSKTGSYVEPGVERAARVTVSGIISNAELDKYVVARPNQKVIAAASVSANCNTTFSAPPGAWRGPWRRACANIGKKGSTFTYSWQLVPGTNQQACLQGQGWYVGYNGSTFGVWSRWYNLGCGTKNTASVPWGEVSAYPQVLVLSTTVHFAQGSFH
ncbi:MAG: hypothetical protein LBG70_02340 [Bifidobacteriaceae bacterium]|nr:hypothetical protein [Bifidobacteriaceae bacterium]